MRSWAREMSGEVLVGGRKNMLEAGMFLEIAFKATYADPLLIKSILRVI